MSKKKTFWLIGVLVLILAITLITVYKQYQAKSTISPLPKKVATALTETPNEPNIGFTPSFQEAKTPLAQVPNYQAVKAKYGLNLSASQEKSLDDNRFLLVDYDQVPFFKPGVNFDQWTTDADTMGGGAIYDRKPEDTVLITPDLALHTYHKYFELTLEELEQHDLNQNLGDFLTGLQGNLKQAVRHSTGTVKERYQNLDAQIIVARVLFETKNAQKPNYFSTPEEETKYNAADDQADTLANAKKVLAKYSSDLTPELTATIEADLKDIYAASSIDADPLFQQYDSNLKTDFTQFTPRSHYTKNSILRSYFRTMIYLGRSSYLLNSELGLGDTALLTKQMAVKDNKGVAPIDYWQKITKVTNFYSGESDDITYDNWNSFVTATLGNNSLTDEQLISSDNIAKLKANLNQLPQPKILSDAIVDPNIANRDKASLLNESLSFRVFGQKFSFDATILNNLTAGQEKTDVKLPSTPSALFISAALGDQHALKYAAQFLQQTGFTDNDINGFLKKLTQEKTSLQNISETEWLNSLNSSWLYVLSALTHNYGSGYPLYMQSMSFLDKQIQTFLGSFTELKHDTLLYAKQSYAEMGAGGDDQPLPPIVKGFVEPNLEFWNRFAALLNRNSQLYEENNVFQNHEAKERLNEFKESVFLFKKIAEEELRNQPISDDDYETLRTTKLSYMTMPFTAVDPTDTSGRTGLVADIHTDTEKSQILYEGTAKPYLMLAIVGNEAAPRVVAGLVFNHYEFTDPIGKRLDDGAWQHKVYEDNSQLPAKNFWYDSLLVK